MPIVGDPAFEEPHRVVDADAAAVDRARGAHGRAAGNLVVGVVTGQSAGVAVELDAVFQIGVVGEALEDQPRALDFQGRKDGVAVDVAAGEVLALVGVLVVVDVVGGIEVVIVDLHAAADAQLEGRVLHLVEPVGVFRIAGAADRKSFAVGVTGLHSGGHSRTGMVLKVVFHDVFHLGLAQCRLADGCRGTARQGRSGQGGDQGRRILVRLVGDGLAGRILSTDRRKKRRLGFQPRIKFFRAGLRGPGRGEREQHRDCAGRQGRRRPLRRAKERPADFYGLR